MKKLFKRNQLMITALAIMLAIAGYLQFAGTNPTEEGLEAGSNNLVNSVEGTITEIFTVEDDLFSDISDIESLDTDSNEYAENLASESSNVRIFEVITGSSSGAVKLIFSTSETA